MFLKELKISIAKAFATQNEKIENQNNFFTKTLQDWNTQIKEHDKKIEAICECIRKDRKDITGLCQIVKKLETKRKK